MPEGMVIKKKLPDLLSLLESHTGTTVPKVPIIPRPPTPIPPALTQTELADQNEKGTRKEVKAPLKRAKKALPEPTKVAKMT